MPFHSGASQLAPVAIVVPIVAACLLLAVGRRLPRFVLDGVATATALAAVGIDAALLVATRAGRVVTWSGGWLPTHGVSVGIALVVGPLSAALALLAAALIVCALLYSWRYFDSSEAHFHALMLLFLAGMTGFSLSGDLFDMFVFFELMGAVAYALTGFKIEDPTAVQGGINFGIINSLGAYFSLAGVAILYAHTGQLGLAQLSVAMSGHSPTALVVVAFVLTATGFMVKAAAVPFHFWTADAEAVAPLPVCVIFSGVMVELGVYGVARLYWIVFSDTLPEDAVSRAMLVFGAVTAVVGGTMCFYQRHLKRLLAYSTIAHVGLFVMAFGGLTSDSLTGGALYVAGHAGVKSALFLLVGVILNRYRSIDEHSLFGRGSARELTPWLMIVGGLGLAALPPFGTGFGKSIAEEALSEAGYPWAPAVFIFASAMTGGAVLRATGRIFFAAGVPPEDNSTDNQDDEDETKGQEEPEVGHPLRRIPLTMLTAILVLLFGSFAVGVLPHAGAAVSMAAERFVDRHGYVSQALHAAAAAPVKPSPKAEWTVLGVALDLVSAASAVAFAAIALYAPRLPALVRTAVRPIAPVLGSVRRLHSGHVGDYVTWLLVGIAGLAALIGIPLV